MKAKWLHGVLAGLLIATGMAWGQTIHTDSSFDPAYTFDVGFDGLNGGTGFGPWSIESNNPGVEGVDVDAKIWGTTDAEITAWTQAFGFIAKGVSAYVNIDRDLETAMSTNDVFEFDFAVNWDGNTAAAEKGFNLYAGGIQIVTVRHQSWTGVVSLNGFTNSPVLAEYGITPMHWTFTVVSSTNLLVTATSRKAEIIDTFSTNLVVSYAHIDSFRFLASEIEAGAPGQRRTYFDNLKLTQYGADVPPAPEPKNISLSASAWAITNLTQTVDFTVMRDFGDAAIEIALSCDNSDMVSGLPASVSMAIGETSTTFSVTATIPWNAAVATITASVDDATVANGSWGLKGPAFSMNAEGVSEVFATTNQTVWIDLNDGRMDESLIAMESSNPSIMTVPPTLDFQGNTYASTTANLAYPGQSTLWLKYAGVVMCEYNFTYSEYGYTLTGPATVRVGSTATYTLSAILTANDTAEISTGGASVGSVTFSTNELSLVLGETAHVTATFGVTGVSTGAVKIWAEGIYSDSIDITILPAKDYSGYIAYDEASRPGYDAGWTLTPSHDSGFADWVEVSNTGDGETIHTGVFVATTVPAGMEDILDEGKAFGMYANGASGAFMEIRRPFEEALALGQKVSIDIGAMEMAGTKGVKFLECYVNEEEEANWYTQAEFFYYGDNYYYNYAGAAEAVNLNWTKKPGVITLSLYREVEEDTYTLSITRDGSTPVEATGLTLAAINGIQVYSFEGAAGDDNNVYFNRLFIEQVETPPPPPPGLAIESALGEWNPDELKTYTYTLRALNGFTGAVVLASSDTSAAVIVAPATITIEAGTETVDFDVTVMALPGEGDGVGTTLTATSVEDSSIQAEYGLTMWNPALSLAPTSGEYEYVFVSGGDIWFQVVKSPSFPYEYDVLTTDTDVLTSSITNLTAKNGDDNYFNVFMEGPGFSSVVITNTVAEKGADYGITVTGSVVIGGDGDITFSPTSVMFNLPDGFSDCEVIKTTELTLPEDTEGKWTELESPSEYEVSPEGKVIIYYSDDDHDDGKAVVYRVKFIE